MSNDPEFHTPEAKPSGLTEAGAIAAPRAGLAIVSLVFGILAFTVLPVVGALVAIVTGHIALGEVRASGGRLRGRGAAKTGLILGYLEFGLLLVAAAIVFFSVGFASRDEAVKSYSQRTAAAESSGVKMANELNSRDLEKLKTLGFTDGDDEDVICVFSDPNPTDGEPVLAVLTSKRLAYLKGDRSTTFELKTIESIMDHEQYQQKYETRNYDMSRYMIEARRRSGGRMRIVVRPYADGPTFYQALQDAWKAASGKPADEKK